MYIKNKLKKYNICSSSMHSREGTKQPRSTIKSALPYTLGITLATSGFVLWTHEDADVQSFATPFPLVVAP